MTTDAITIVGIMGHPVGDDDGRFGAVGIIIR